MESRPTEHKAPSHVDSTRHFLLRILTSFLSRLSLGTLQNLTFFHCRLVFRERFAIRPAFEVWHSEMGHKVTQNNAATMFRINREDGDKFVRFLLVTVQISSYGAMFITTPYQNSPFFWGVTRRKMV